MLFSFAMAALVSQRVFERLPHLEDEVAYLFQARTLARGQAVIDSPQPARPYWQPFVVDLNGKRFGKYPPGWPGMLAAGVLLGEMWVINAFLAALTVGLTYRLGREIFDADTGVFAAALTAFSPMALMLNGTLMGHTAALFTTTLFLYAYWRLTRGKRAVRWAVMAGAALGLTVINRPLAGLAIAAPLVAYSGVRLVLAWARPETPPPNRIRVPKHGEGEEENSHPLALSPEMEREQEDNPHPQPLSLRARGVGKTERWDSLRRVLGGLLVLAGVTAVLAAAIPAYSYMATGDARKNLYTLVWSYDQVGFGEGYGRNVHTLEKGIRQTRWDLSMMAADVFGWQTGSFGPEQVDHILNQANYWDNVGLSWILIPFGLLIGFKRRWWWWAIWLAAGTVIFMQTTTLPVDTLRDPKFALLWMGGGAVWMLIPFVFLLIGKVDEQQTWTWVLLTIPLCLIGLHIAYWIGSQRYSTRYYFEGLVPLALLSGLALSWLGRRTDRLAIYILVGAVMIYSLLAYSQPRITPLYRFNWVSTELIDAVNARREGDRPVLVIVSGTDVRWRSYGSLMVVTSPFLDSDIVAALDSGAPGVRDSILARFPDRQVIELTATMNWACFGETLEGECYGDPPQGG